MNLPGRTSSPYILNVTMADIENALKTPYAPSPLLSALNRVLNPNDYGAAWHGEKIILGVSGLLVSQYLELNEIMKENEKHFWNWRNGGSIYRFLKPLKGYSVNIYLDDKIKENCGLK